MEHIVIIGADPASHNAASILPDARRIAPPEATAWHAEPGRVWTESASGVESVPFTKLLLCEDSPLLLMALGCAFAGGRPVVDGKGETTVPGVFAAGPVLGASDGEAARQGRIAASAMAGLPVEGTIAASPLPDSPPTERLDPLDLAILLERPPSPERNRIALAQANARGPKLSGIVAPALPVGFAALAAMAPTELTTRGPQDDTGVLA